MIHVEFLPEALAELNHAYDGYEAAKIGLGMALLNEVERLIGILLKHPEIGAPRSYGTRHLPLHRFPYLLVYRLRDDLITITAVPHQRQKPNYWKNRLKDLPN